MVGWHHRHSQPELKQTLGDSGVQGTWHAAVLGITRIRHNLATEQGKQMRTSTHTGLPSKLSEI